MIHVTYKGVTLHATQCPLVRTLDHALAWAQASDDLKTYALKESTRSWRNPRDFYPDPLFREQTVTGADWDFLLTHPAWFGLFDIPDTPTQFASSRTHIAQVYRRPRPDLTDVIVYAIQYAARIARTDPQAWAFGVLTSNPALAQADMPISRQIRDGWLSMYASPTLFEGGSPRLALALAECARAGVWGVDEVRDPLGQSVPIGNLVWNQLDPQQFTL